MERGFPVTTSERVLPSRVLVALDGSPAAAMALPLARMLAAQLGGAVEVVHVASEQVPDPDLWRRIHLDLKELEAVQIRSNVGEPAAGILQAAAELGVALLVLTTHGRIVEPGRHLGRVAEAVVAATARPVVLVRPEAVAEFGVRPLRRLLLPMDGTPTTAAALRPVTELACRLKASVDLLYVASPHEALPAEPGSIGAPQYVDQAQHEWPQWASEVIDRLCKCLARCPDRVPVRMFLAQGEIESEIRDFAAAHQSDAIAVVRRSRLEPGRAPVLRALLDQTACPLLIVGGSLD